MKIEIDDSHVDELVVQVLEQDLENLEFPCCVPNFSFDEKEEKKMVKKLKKALKIAIAYHTVRGNVEELLK